jgi:hypothetical protein
MTQLFCLLPGLLLQGMDMRPCVLRHAYALLSCLACRMHAHATSCAAIVLGGAKMQGVAAWRGLTN